MFTISWIHSRMLNDCKNFLNSPYFKREKSKISDTRKLSIFSLDIEMPTEKQYCTINLVILYLKTLIEVIFGLFIKSCNYLFKMSY